MPLLASWKGVVPAGKVVDDLIDFSDFYATFAELGGEIAVLGRGERLVLEEQHVMPMQCVEDFVALRRVDPAT